MPAAAPTLRSRLAAPRLDFASFRRQESVQILLNLAVMVGLMSLHALFRPIVGKLSLGASIAFAARFAMQLAELALLHRRRASLSPRAVFGYARFSIAANIAFALLVSALASGPENHYVVLMVIPVIAAAFRLSLPGLALVVAAVITLTVRQVWVLLPRLPQAELVESFEATTVSLIFLVVAAVCRLMAELVWHRERELERSLDELAAARDKLVAEEKLAAVGRLAAAIAHEIRNPVGLIASSVAAASRPQASPELREEVFDILKKESARLQKMTEDFLSYARARPPERRPTLPADCLGLVLGLAKAKAADASIALTASPAPESPVALDPFQIQQALLNLVLNALDATPRGGEVRLSARVEAEVLVLGVEGTGEPIPPEVVGRLGEPFFSTKPAGSGLGLAIARKVALAHGGELRLAENSRGRVRFEISVRQ